MIKDFLQENMKKIIISAVSVLIVGTLGITGICIKNKSKTETESKEPELQTVSLSEVTRSIFYAPQYVALSKGFFEEEGLKIELATAQGADAVMTSVLANQSDIGFAGPEASVYVYNEGKEDYTEVFAQLTKRDGSFLVSRNENKDFKWTDVKGSVIIPGRKGGVPYMTLLHVLRKYGIDPSSDVTLDDSISFDLMAGAFSAGNADYVALFEPTASATEIAGKGYIVSSIGSETDELPYTAYFAKKSYIEKNPEIIQKFTNAIYKGQLWVKEHTSEEIAETIVDYFPDTDMDLLVTVLNRYREIDVWNETPYLAEEGFDLLQTIIEEAGELKQRAPYSKVINNSFAEEAVK